MDASVELWPWCWFESVKKGAVGGRCTYLFIVIIICKYYIYIRNVYKI